MQKVKDIVSSLVALRPENHERCTALKIVAGGKLYSVVVEDERVGKDPLEERRDSEKRVTSRSGGLRLPLKCTPQPYLLYVTRRRTRLPQKPWL